MKRLILIIFILSATVSAYAETEIWRSVITMDGKSREFKAYVPASYEYGKKMPLVVILHGGGGQAEQIERFTNFSELAENEGFIAAYPQGFAKQWNDGRDVQSIRAQRLNLDDVGFISSMIQTIEGKYTVDPDRIYAVGISNGGFMCQRLACELPDKLAAVASIAAAMPSNLMGKCAPASKVSVLIMNGTDDPLVPYNGGAVKAGPFLRGNSSSTSDTVNFWIKYNGCIKDRHAVQDKDPSDGTRMVVDTFKAKKQPGADVWLYTVVGGGHTWPGASQYLPENTVGRVSKEINATEVVWQFFKTHPKVR